MLGFRSLENRIILYKSLYRITAVRLRCHSLRVRMKGNVFLFVQLSLEVAELRRLLDEAKASPSARFHGSLEEATELEYLRNILYDYMMGKQSTVNRDRHRIRASQVRGEHSCFPP